MVSAAAHATRSSTDYFPLKQGNSWKYAVTGGVAPTDVATVTNVTHDKNGTTVTVTWQSDGKKVIYQSNSHSLSVLDARERPPLMPILRYPVKSGAKWTWKSQSTTAFGQVIPETWIMMVNGPTTIKTPAGAFQAMHVHSEMKLSKPLRIGPVGPPGMEFATHQSIDYWYAKGVGLVQEKFSSGSEFVLTKLVSYTLK
jgi:hypothetical protein